MLTPKVPEGMEGLDKSIVDMPEAQVDITDADLEKILKGLPEATIES